MNIIVAADRNWGIGYKGKLLVSIPRDARAFREETLGKVIIMGRATLMSFPGSQPLYGRENIVLSRNKDFQVKGATVLGSVEECLDYIRKKNYKSSDVFVIGGESIYKAFLPYCDIAHVTYIDYEYAADRYINNLDMDREWSMVLETEEETYFNIPYTFRLYRKLAGER